MKSRVNKYSIHPGQIPTNLKTIKWKLFMRGHSAISSLLKCLASEPDNHEQTKPRDSVNSCGKLRIWYAR